MEFRPIQLYPKVTNVSGRGSKPTYLSTSNPPKLLAHYGERQHRAVARELVPFGPAEAAFMPTAVRPAAAAFQASAPSFQASASAAPALVAAAPSIAATMSAVVAAALALRAATECLTCAASCYIRAGGLSLRSAVR
jgi:hypothetical protein